MSIPIDDRLVQIYRKNREGFTVIMKDNKIKKYKYKEHGRYVVSYKTVITVDEFAGIVNYYTLDFKDGIYGGWYDEDDGIFYIEKNKTFEHFIDALQYAYQNKQKYIWDGQKRQSIIVEQSTYRDGKCEQVSRIRPSQYKVSDILQNKEEWIKKKLDFWKRFHHRWKGFTNFTPRHLNGKLRINSSANPFDTTAGHYDFITGDIVIDWYGLKQYANIRNLDPIEVLCSVISHETLHYIIHKEHGFEATYKFDCIAGIMEWYSQDLHAGMPLNSQKTKDLNTKRKGM